MTEFCQQCPGQHHRGACRCILSICSCAKSLSRSLTLSISSTVVVSSSCSDRQPSCAITSSPWQPLLSTYAFIIATICNHVQTGSLAALHRMCSNNKRYNTASHQTYCCCSHVNQVENIVGWSRVQRPTRHNIGHLGGGLHCQSLDWYWRTKQYRKIQINKRKRDPFNGHLSRTTRVSRY